MLGSEREKSVSKGFIDYGEQSYCGYCGRKVKHGEEGYAKDGKPIHRKCGRLLRRNPHNKVKTQ